MSTVKTDKEIAFLHDLFVATDWGERFAALIDENITLPDKGRVLYLGSGTGSHVLALAERAGDKLSFVCVEEHEEYLEIARSKATVENVAVEFRLGRIDKLSFAEDEFDAVIGDGSLVSPARVESMLKEMVRVARPGAAVAFVLTTASSFGEFFSIYWELLHSSGLEQESNVETLISELQSVSEIEEAAENAGLEGVTSVSRIEEFHYDSGEQFVNSPLVADFLMKRWIESLPEYGRAQVIAEIPRLVDEDRQQADFIFSVKATLVSGPKAQTH
ncbi:MAG TPA: class I SAM-dependent methyltransferase [Pyrinomonadaceae bacterium]|nr:class I SAM-dependent methyltransferase [Pyrinomonadaceae bacterium]